ncbi:hypothetical protein LEP1GSC018_0868 [Leptospira kirschneri str. 2008720114]|nr:hypothetical protein LEP1GSC018_0868 [Leptospira kirschneri str. 2008720114]
MWWNYHNIYVLELDFENVGTHTNFNHEKRIFKNSQCHLICGNSHKSRFYDKILKFTLLEKISQFLLR